MGRRRGGVLQNCTFALGSGAVTGCRGAWACMVVGLPLFVGRWCRAVVVGSCKVCSD